MGERTLERTERAYLKMELVAKALELASPNGAKYRVEDVYLDYGQDWMWTTIVRHGYKECQVLNPREWEDIVFYADDAHALATVVDNIRADKFFGDN